MNWLGRFIHGQDLSSPLRDGFLGLGGGASKTDRGDQLAARSADWNLFGRGLGLSDQLNTSGQRQQEQGQSTLDSATNYWKSVLGAGRAEAAKMAAPAVNAQIAQSDAQRNQDSQFGSGRSGANVAATHEAGVNSQKNVDDIINENLVGGRQAAASGLASAGGADLAVGSSSLAQALNSLGISGSAANNILDDAAGSRKYSDQKSQEQGQAAGKAAAMLALAFL